MPNGIASPVFLFLAAAGACSAGQPAATGRLPAPLVSLRLGSRTATARPFRVSSRKTAAGTITVSQPTANVLVATMMGVAVAPPYLCQKSVSGVDFDLDQCFEIVLPAGVASARLTIEAEMIGFLSGQGTCMARSSAGTDPATACITADCHELLAVALPAQFVSHNEVMLVNCQETSPPVSVGPGKFQLHQHWQITADHPCTLFSGKYPSAEFSRDSGLNPRGLLNWAPYAGADKRTFGFRVRLIAHPE